MIATRLVELAKVSDWQGIDDLLKEGCIDEWLSAKPSWTATAQLAADGCIAGVEYLLSLGADIDGVVVAAAASGDQAWVDDLLVRGGSISKFAVFYAAAGGHLALTENLLALGADIGVAVQGAAYGNEIILAESLLKRGANITRALQGAVQGNHAQLMEDLLKRGAEIEHVVNAAAARGDEALTDNMLKRGARIDSAIGGAAIGDQAVLVKKLRLRGGNVNDAVQGAAWAGHMHLVIRLLACGADPRQAIATAIKARHAALTEELLDRGASFASALIPEIFSRLDINDVKSRLKFLSAYSDQYISKLTNSRFKYLAGHPPVEEEIIQHAKQISIIRKFRIPFEPAMMMTMRNEKNQLINNSYLLIAATVMLDAASQSSVFPRDLWPKILNYGVGLRLSKQTWERIALYVAKRQVVTILDDYTRVLSKGKHKGRADSYKNAIQNVKTAAEFTSLFVKQSEILKDSSAGKDDSKSPKHEQRVKNKTVDGYNIMIHRWARRYTLVGNMSEQAAVVKNNNDNQAKEIEMTSMRQAYPS